jgi:two-component system sensor histidine kinase HydH
MSSRRLVPLAVVAVIALMGAALLVTAWSTHQSVEDASATLARGQADAVEHAVRAQLADLEGPPAQADLERILAEESPRGLRYLAVAAPNLSIEAGQALGGPPTRLPPVRAHEPVFVDGRVRAVLRAPGRRTGLRGAHVVVEIDPVEARALRAAAARNVWIGTLGAGALLIVAAGLVRWVVRREASAREAERARRLASLGELSAVLAHEIRNPLASLKGNAQLLAEVLPAGEKARQRADRVVDEALRLETLTNDLLDFVRGGEIHRAPVDPAALLRESAASVDAAIEVDAARAPTTWSLDGERVRQVLTNLLENAVQAGAPVRASVASARGELVFEVRDGGPGVPAEDLERIFEPFYTKRVRGTGLGLAVVKRVVELHRGAIRVANDPAGGAVFRVTLPSHDGAHPGR